MKKTGAYANASYVAALELGTPRQLPRSGGWIIERPIPAFPTLTDAMGPYPLFSCPDWSGLADDLRELVDLVSLVLVTDPFAPPPVPRLSELFPDVALRFKDHYVCDLSIPLERSVSSHHRRYARAAQRALTIEACTPSEAMGEWIDLYDHLKERHGITGITRFSPSSFRRQLALPGLLAFRARTADETVAMALFLRDGDRAYYHLGASSPLGYQMRASFGIFWTALERLARSDVRIVDLGAGPSGTSDDGLVRFKSGWATQTLPTWLCGRIFSQSDYRDLVALTGTGNQVYFPAYRSDEP